MEESLPNPMESLSKRGRKEECMEAKQDNRQAIMEEKKAVRKEVQSLRRSQTESQIHAWSQEITKRLMAQPEYQASSCIYAYMDYNHEVETRMLIEKAWADGKRVAVPRVQGKEMEFYYIESFDQLEQGYFGILEPREGLVPAREADALLLLPGVAFDEALHRVGYGGGFYDRYQEAWPGLTTVALAFEFQVFPKVPFEAFDKTPQKLITQQRCLESLDSIGSKAKAAEPLLACLTTEEKNQVLELAAKQLLVDEELILSANALDMEAGRAKGMPEGLLDRLKLSHDRIVSMQEGFLQVASLPDPIGSLLSERRPPNGLHIRQVRVPLGVVGIIYEARPNVTADAFGLCFKTGNAVILRGGSDAIHSNQAIVDSLRRALAQAGKTEDAVQLIGGTSRETAAAFMRMDQYVDVLIPRGSAGLIYTVVHNSTIPVIETGSGNCHIYVDEGADISMALDIIYNAKTQRIGVCNACESLIVHESMTEEFLPLLEKRLQEKQVELRGDEKARAAVSMTAATEADWGMEYLDYILSVKTVSSLEEAIAHINRYNTGHSEAIITNNQDHAEQFLKEVDAAAVYVNASTRFTDGFEFGFGAEIGISTQKLHARGPMGLEALTSSKYEIYGTGQVRA